ncbi:MAG: molybdenum cofactor guanylyltransferase [Burkholderiaceae bacterium]|nr:MAG: molybdenum cofactor guanylyltransferase [Burkholderiaceae bacterium]
MTLSALPAVTAIILAGGRATRMGGCDKGLQTLGGVTLIEHVLRQLRQQTRPPAAILISANRHLSAYRALGLPVWPDASPDYPGPLAGFLSGLAHCETPLLLTVPCDVPRFPAALCERLATAIERSGVDIAVATTAGPATDQGTAKRPQPTFCLMRRQLRTSLTQFLARGERKAGAWIAQHAAVTVAFEPEPGDAWRAFTNVNTRAELDELESAHRSTEAAPVPRR